MVVAATVLSASGLIVRHVEHASGWQIVFFRACSLIPTICAVYLWRHRGRALAELRRAGLSPILAGAFSGVGSVCFILALTKTTIASAMFVLSAVPFFAAGFGWLFIRERVDFGTLVAIVASSLGIGLVMMDGFASGTLDGNLLALANSVLIACYIVVLRRSPRVDMLPAGVVGAMVAASLAALAAPDLHVTLHDALLCVLWGTVVQGTAQVMTVFAARHLRAAELCLLSLIEFVLAPIWVWLWLGEIPGAISAVGGAIVLLSVALWSIRGMERRQPRLVGRGNSAGPSEWDRQS